MDFAFLWRISHVIQETYRTSDHQIFRVDGTLDFGVNTYRVLKDVRTFEDLHLRSYDRGFMPSRSTFPGFKAVNAQSLSPDTVPLQFPESVWAYHMGVFTEFIEIVFELGSVLVNFWVYHMDVCFEFI